MKRTVLLDAERELTTVRALHEEIAPLVSEYRDMRVVVREPDGAEWTVMTKVERAAGKPAVLVLTGKRTTVED